MFKPYITSGVAAVVIAQPVAWNPVHGKHCNCRRCVK